MENPESVIPLTFFGGYGVLLRVLGFDWWVQNRPDEHVPWFIESFFNGELEIFDAADLMLIASLVAGIATLIDLKNSLD